MGFFLKKIYLLCGFYLCWALYQEYSNLIFNFWIFYLSWLELFSILDLLDWIIFHIYIYIYIYIRGKAKIFFLFNSFLWMEMQHCFGIGLLQKNILIWQKNLFWGYSKWYQLNRVRLEERSVIKFLVGEKCKTMRNLLKNVWFLQRSKF